MKRQRDRKRYSAYVETIVNMRLLKLLKDGFTVDGFHPTITSDHEFRCIQRGHSTPISSVRISSSDIPPVVMPRQSKGCGRGQGKGCGRGQGKGCGRGRGRGRGSDTDSEGEYRSEEEYKDEEEEEEEDKDEDEDEEEDDDIRPYYWCIGCSEWHEIVTFLLP
jgi:hypothetical protein